MSILILGYEYLGSSIGRTEKDHMMEINFILYFK